MNLATYNSVRKDPQSVMNHHAKSFSWAAKFLSPSARHDAALLYAFARTADDLADEAHLGSLQQRSLALQELRKQALKPASPHKDQVEPSLANQTGIDLDAALLKNLEKKTQRDATRHHDNPKLQS